MAPSRLCSIPECGKPHLARSWCREHYYRWFRNGDPFGGKTSMRAAANYFREVVLTYREDDCLKWPFATDQDGYGRVRLNGRLERVSRMACWETYGPPPTGIKYAAAHSCNNGHLGCCNPRHLSWKTYSENEADKMANGTFYIGKWAPGHKRNAR